MSLFGQSTPSGSSPFGQPAQQNQSGGTTSGGLFSGGVFGGQAQKPGGLFGQAQPQQQQQQQGGIGSGGLLGQGTQAQPNSLFGQANQNQQTGNTIGLGAFGQQQKPSPFDGGGLGLSTAKSSLFGGAPIPTSTHQQPQLQLNTASVLGGSFLGSQIQPSATAAAAAQPAGAYFDSLFAKTQKAGTANSNTEDLPSLELGLGDLRHRLRKLQAKQTDRADGKAHYLLAASGVDPGAAAKDLGLLDVQGGRTERATHGYAPSDVDVETYLSNLQTKTTLSMIQDGLERSLRDFDTFLEDNVAMEWDAQRKRIYQHFGIKPRESSAGREAQGGFGRSRRSKAQGNAPRAARNSMFGNSTFQRSVIGAPTRIGAHQSEFSDVDRSTDSPGKSRNEDRALRDRQAKLAEKVRSLNAARLLGRPYPILAELAEVEQKSHEPHAPHVVEAYRAMIEVVGEDADAETTLNSATAKERQFAGMYLDENANSPQSVEMRKRILSGANAFLEKQFLREVESLIAKHPHEAKLGGLPDITSKVKAYIRLRSARKDLVPDNTELQQLHGEYVWAIVFYLLRSGHVNEAAKYVNDNSNHFRGIDRTFATYLNNYAASEDRRITNRKLLDRCTNEYIQRSRNAPENTIDPFRMACYKVIGRIELSNRNLEGLNTDINDWIWLQFNLAREGDKALEMAGESYALADLQASIKEIGQKHFPKTSTDDSNGSCGMFFYLQILSGMFEDAVAYLYPFSYVDAVHFGLALEFYGLLRPSDPMSACNDLRTHSIKGLPQINFGRMIGYYTRDFRAADAVSAVDYLTMICLNQDLGGEAGERHSSLCHEALRDLVLETREFSKLIGDIRPDGRRILGVVEGRGPLIGLDGQDDFVNTVTLQAASFADENGRTTDSVLLYHLAGEYDAVVAIVSRALSEAISLEIGEDPMRLLPVKPRSGDQAADAQQGSSLSLAAIDDPVELAKTMMTMYERDAMFHRKIQDQNKVACRVLLQMSTIKSLVEAGYWAQCLDKIRALDILPLEAGGDASTIRAYASKFSSLSQPVSINVPNLIMWTIISCVRQKEQLMNGQFSGNEGTRRMMVEQLKQMILDLTTYTSQLRYRFPPHLHEALARASAERRLCPTRTGRPAVTRTPTEAKHRKEKGGEPFSGARAGAGYMGPWPAGRTDGPGPGGGESGAGARYGNMAVAFASKREVEAASLSDGGGGGDAATGAAAEAVAKRRKTGTGSRGVANLTPEQLAKKRANDREAQRAIRERTKNQIEELERRIEELTNQRPYQELQAVIRAKEAVELENADIKRHLVSVINMLKPLIGLNAAAEQQACTSPAQPYTSVAAQMSNSLNYHVATPTSSASPAGGGLDQQHHHAHQPPQQSWPSGEHSSTGGTIDDHTRAQLEQQRHGLRHGLGLGHERLDLDFLLAPGQRVPRLQRGINGAQDTPEYRHVPMKHDWTLVGHETMHGRPNNAWESPGLMSVPVSLPSHHGHDSEASSPGYARRDASSHHGHGHGPSPGPGPSPGLGGGSGGGGFSLMPDPEARADPESPARHALPVRNSSPTCPLDSLLLDFVSERRHRAGEGLSPHEVAGPRYPSVSSLLNPANSAFSHPLSKFFTDILAKFPDISRLPEKVAVLYVMFLLMRWQIWPTRANYERLPEWIVPLPCQLMEPHAAWIDHLPFPRMREKLIKHSPTAEHLFDDFFVPFTTTLCLSWPYEETDALLQNPDSDELMINPVFERHLRNLENWKLGKAFADAFPILAGTCKY